jgi:polyhydroxybutyrate depolymerase
MHKRTATRFFLILPLFTYVLTVGVQSRLPAGVTQGKVLSAGRKRTYLVYTPATYNPAAPAPLVISLHGFASWPANHMHISQWNRIADDHGFIVTYPSGVGFPRRWNARGLAGSGAADDVAFIADLIDALSRQFSIDPARIYVNGLSNGGGMSNLVACRLADRIAAMGGVAGAYMNPAGGCRPARPVPIIAFHGTADRIVPYGGSTAGDRQGFALPAVRDWAATWAERNGCDATPQALPVMGEVSGVRYTNCKANAEVILYTVQGGGHNWPGGGRLPEAIVGHMTEDVHASQLMWKFFVQHPLE